jgi:outer membrane PBP1 activator LpoA protein
MHAHSASQQIQTLLLAMLIGSLMSACQAPLRAEKSTGNKEHGAQAQTLSRAHEKSRPHPQASLTYPSQLALLLPLSGKERLAGVEVRDGFLAALLELSPEQRPIVNVYDSNEAGALAAYQHALGNGAKFVVGPLLKDDVAALIASQQISMPTLALNYPPSESAVISNLFQFWLDPTEDAQQVAARLVDQGLLHGIALLPKNEWGARVNHAFEAELTKRGGVLLKRYFYDPSARDYTEAVSTLLSITESKARAASLSETLHTKLHFEPRPRSDVEFVFIGAEPKQGRMIRPAFQFHLTEPVPIFATADTFKPNLAANSDLDGVMFPDMPWVVSPDEVASRIRTTISTYWPERARESGRLYAMGFDACQLIPLLLSQSTSEPVKEMQGVTGELLIDDDGHVHRNLDWVRIDNGRLQLLDTNDSLHTGS